MATFTKRILSASTNGCGIQVNSVGGGGTAGTIHQAVAGTADMDEVWLYAVNKSTAGATKLTLEWGTSGTSGQIEINVESESGLVLVSPGLPLQNSLLVTAFAGSSGDITLHGYVNRITV
jgi:hypothetical protein